MTTKEYMPVPVADARWIAEQYAKSIVIILAWDREHGALHTTTYGASAEDKVCAAHGGEIATAALGCDLSKARDYEDFRTQRMQEMLEVLKLYQALDDKHANCPECDGAIPPEACPECFPLADDARCKMRAIIAKMA
jgi:hypothetical protein